MFEQQQINVDDDRKGDDIRGCDDDECGGIPPQRDRRCRERQGDDRRSGAKNVQGQVVCATAGGNLNIAIGEATTGIAAVLSADASSVQSVGLGNVNGVTLGYTAGVPGGGANATATKDGNTYKISGTATGVDMANPMQPVTKPFEIQVTCP